MERRREHGHGHGHDHDHHDHHSHDHGHDHHHDHGGAGHNRAPERSTAQWQTPHNPEEPRAPIERDLDQVEAAFIDGFIDARDPVSFLRLGHIPFEVIAGDGTKLNLLRVEIDALADVGSLTPHLGGGSFRYDPLPGSLVSHRRRLRFVYFDGDKLRPLTFSDVRALNAGQ
jgi:hypothetical protein